MSNDLGLTAGEACASIVNHYSDPIHYASFLPSEDSDADDDAQQSNVSYPQSNDKSAPYFDTTLGQPMPDLAPVCGFWYQQLLEVSARAGSMLANKNASLDAAQELLRCYGSSIHPCIKRIKVSAPGMSDEDNELEREVPVRAMVEILRNYELLLAHFMRDASTKSVEEVSVVKKESSDLIEVISGIDNNSMGDLHEDLLGRAENAKSGLDVCKMLYVIADDVFQWSASMPKKDKAALWKVQNVLLPCLLRLIEHSVVLLASQNQDGDNSILFNTQLREGLAIATVTAISFVGDGKLKSGVFGIGSLLHWMVESTNEDGHVDASMPPILSLAHTLQSCSHSISKTEESNVLPESIVSSNFMTRSVVDWSVPSAHFDARWTDGVTGVGSRVAMGLLRKIQQSSCCVASSSMEGVEGNNCSGNRTYSLRLLLRKISGNIGIDILASTTRAHFFGRLSCSSDANAIVQPQDGGVFMPMVKRIGSNNHKRAAARAVSSDEKPHIDIPMRLSAAAIILCAALPQHCNNFEMWDKAFSDALPIAMSLLDDIQSIHQAIGALIFVSVIEAASSFELEVIPSFVEKFGSVVTSSLESAIQICGREEPTVLTIICLAQSKWINYLGLYSRNPDSAISPSEVQAMAHKAAADILIAIRKQAQTGGRDDSDERIAGALVAGINPLLAQLTSLPEAASVELARVGLSALLPLVGWSGMRLEVRSAQVSALVGLISLMNGAYPIMPHHGKKIMTEVFLLLDRADKDAAFLSNNKTAGMINGKNHDDEISTDATIKVALYAASVALTICGCSAETVLEHIESTQSSRKPLINRCFKIRATSGQLRGSI